MASQRFLKKLARLLAALLAGLTLLAALLVGFNGHARLAAAAPAAATVVTGTITSDTTWTVAGSPYTVTTNVIVNAQLTIQPGVTVVFLDTGTGAGLTFDTGGELVAVGTAANPILFTSGQSSPAPGDWDGLTVLIDALTATLEHAVVEYGSKGIELNSTASHQVLSSTFRLIGSSSAILGTPENSTFSYNQIYSATSGISLQKPGNSIIANNQIYNITDDCIVFPTSAVVGDNNLIADNLLYNCGGAAIVAFKQDNLTIQNNQIYSAALTSREGAIQLESSRNTSLQGNYLHDNGGAAGYEGAVVVRNHGLGAIGGSNLLLNGNRLTDANASGLVFLGTYNPGLQQLSANAICVNTQFEIEDQNTSGATIGATGNWLGTNFPVAGTEITGTVTISPYIELAALAAPLVVPADGTTPAVIGITMNDGAGNTMPVGARNLQAATSLGSLSNPAPLLDGTGSASTNLTSGAPGTAVVTITEWCGYAVTTTVEFQATDLSITKAANAAQIIPGQPVTYTLSYAHSGAAATNVTLTDTLPAGMVWLTDTADSLGFNRTATAPAVVWQTPSLSGSGVITLVAHLPGGSVAACGQTLTNTVEITSATANSSSATLATDAGLPVVCANLSLSKDDGRTTVQPGDLLTYTVTVTNSGSTAAVGTVLTDAIPANTAFVAASNGGSHSSGVVTWPAFDLPAPPGANVASRTVTVQVNQPFPVGVSLITNTATVAQAADSTPANNTALDVDTVQQVAVLQVTKTSGLLCAAPNQTITYTISYSNSGSATAPAVTLTEVQPEYTNFLVGGLNAGWNSAGSGVYTQALGPVAPGGPYGPLYYQVRVLDAASIPASVTAITNVVQLDGATFTEVLPLPLAPDLVVAKNDNVGITAQTAEFAALYQQVTGQPAPQVGTQAAVVGPGDIIDYTIVYANNGRGPATGVVLTETLPANTSYAGGSEWSNVSGNIYQHTVGNLAAGAGGFVPFRVQLAGSLPSGLAYIVNRVEIGGNQSGQECNPANSISYEQTPVTTTTTIPPGSGTVYLPIVMKEFRVQPATISMVWDGLETVRDKVSDVNGGVGLTPDGRDDGVFDVSLDLGSTGPKTVAHVRLTSNQPFEWDTIPTTSQPVLGILNGGAYQNNGDGSMTQVITMPLVVSLYASDSDTPSRFPPDTYLYTVYVTFTDGTVLSASATIPPAGGGVTPPPALPPEPQSAVSAVTVDPATNQIFVASPKNDHVTVIDGGSDTVDRTVPVGNGPTGLALFAAPASANNRVYVAHQYGANYWAPGVRLFNVGGSDSRDTDYGGYVGAAPVKAAAHSSLERVYVSNYYDKLAVLNADTETRLGWVVQKGFQAAYGLDTSSATGRVYLATRDTGELVIFDGLNDRLLQSTYIPTHVKPPQVCSLWSVGVNENTGHVFVPCPQWGTVFVLQESQVSVQDLERVAKLERRPEGLAKVVAAAAAPWLVEISVPGGANLGEEGIAVDDTTGRVFITNARTDTVVVLQDGATPAYETTVAVGDEPQGIGVNPATQKVYVANNGDNTVTVLQATPPYTQVATIPLN